MSEVRMRTEVVCFRVTRDELHRLTRAASDNNMPRATFIRFAVSDAVADYGGNDVFHVNTPTTR